MNFSLKGPLGRAALPAILVLSGGLRVWPLGWGGPVWHPDEIFMVVFPLNLFSGDLNPHHFYYPSLHFYLLGLVYGAVWVGQKLLGAGWSVPEFVAFHYFWQPEGLLVWGRLVSVAFALGTVVWAFRLGERVYGPGGGVWAALLVGVGTVHVRQSLLCGVDVAMSFWFLGAVWSGVRLLEGGGWRDYVLCGVLVGLAGGSKYPGALSGVAVLAGHLLAGRSLWEGRLWVSGLVSVGVFLGVSPYVLLDWKTFGQHFLFQAAHLEQGRGEWGMAWWYHLKVSLRYSLGWLGLVGLGVGLVQAGCRPRREVGVVLAGFLGYYLVMGSGKLVFVRYALPLLVLQGVLVGGVIHGLRGGWVRWGLGGLVAWVALYGSVRVVALASAVDTRVAARGWVEKQVPEGTAMGNFGGWAGDVQLHTFENFWWLIKYFELSFGRERLEQAIAFLQQHPAPAPFYSHAVLASDQKLAAGSLAVMADNECPYVVLHRHPLSYSRIDPAFADSLAARGERVARFAPQGLASAAPHYDPIDAYYLPLGDFGDLQQPGPEIEIWRVKQYEVPPPRAWTTEAIFARGYAKGAAEALGENALNRALDLAERAVNLDPGGFKGQAALAQTYLARGEHDQAIRAYKHLLALGRGGVEEYNNLGIACWGAGRREEAVQHWQRALELRPDKADVHYNLGLARYLSGNRQTALQHWQQAATLHPPSAKAHHNLGVEYRDSGQDSLAVYHLEQALAAQPDFAGAAYELGRLYYDRKQYSAAITALEKALALEADRPETYLYLGNACVHRGLEEEARKWFGELVRRFPAHPQAGEIGRMLGTAP